MVSGTRRPVRVQVATNRAKSAAVRRVTAPICVWMALLAGGRFCFANEPERRAELPELQYVDHQALPDFQIDGQTARIHTQGVFVTERFYYVTGRLERNPRRPLLVRFDRYEPTRVEHVDLLVACGATAPEDAALDHPGGFDFDGESFWIPLAISKPNSRSLIVKVRPEAEQPLAMAKGESAFRLDDHIGAIACDATTGRLYGANWDTKLTYIWKQDGTLVQKFPQTELLPKDAERAFAVQDWKGLGQQRVIAGASDKSSHRKPEDSSAVLQLIDMGRKRELGVIRLASPPERDVRLTREGMAVRGDEVFFLPADLEDNAEVYRYRWSKPLRWSKE